MKPYESKDKPAVPTYPWELVLWLSGAWGATWLVVWAACKGTTGALVVASGSYDNLTFLPWAVLVHLAIWIGALAWVWCRIRAYRNPPAVVFFLALILSATFLPTSFYMLRRIDSMKEYELSALYAQTFMHLLEWRIPDILALAIAPILGATVNVVVIRRKYCDIPPTRLGLMVLAWSLAAPIAILIGQEFGTMWGFLSGPAIGNIVTIKCFRDTLELRDRDRQQCT